LDEINVILLEKEMLSKNDYISENFGVGKLNYKGAETAPLQETVV